MSAHQVSPLQSSLTPPPPQYIDICIPQWLLSPRSSYLSLHHPAFAMPSPQQLAQGLALMGTSGFLTR